MGYTLNLRLVTPEEHPNIEAAARSTRASGTPFLNFFAPTEILALARASGFKDVRHVSSRELSERYFAGRVDGLRPSSGEELLVATTIGA